MHRLLALRASVPNLSSMALKRASERGEASDQPGATVKRQKTGFRIGPDNLPDGTHRRKGIRPPETLKSPVTFSLTRCCSAEDQT